MRVRRISVIAIGLAALLLAAAPAPAADPHEATSFAFAIGNGNLSGGPEEVAERLGAYDLVVVDGEYASAEEIAAVQARGTTVLGYLSVGTIEKWRSWYPRVKRYRLGAWADWKDEWFADVSEPALREILSGEIAPQMLAKGFDGLFLDNVDMIEAHKHVPQRSGMRELVLALSDLTRSQGRYLFAQNGLWGLRKLGLVDAIDGWNREDVTWTYDFDRRRYMRNPRAERRTALRELAQMAARGLVTTTADYTREGDTKATAQAVRNSCSVGALPYVGDIGLTARRLSNPPLNC
jgi:uncharacterized protein (TIGR01370 family)